MNFKIIIFLAGSLIGYMYFIHESAYDKMMNPIKKLKIAEKQAGDKNPMFDGFNEPDFPDEVKNSKGLEGVDANLDGVRDDIEIWINKTAEDRNVRMAFKDFYRREIELIKAASSHKSVDEVIELEANVSDAGVCLWNVTEKYDIHYRKNIKTLNGKKFSIAGEYYVDALYILLPNTNLRKGKQMSIDVYRVGRSVEHANGIFKKALETCSFKVE